MTPQPKKPASMWERYQTRAATRPDHRHTNALADMRSVTNTQTELLEHMLEMLADHANMLDALKLQLKETKEFMDWATTTHTGLLGEYNAVKDVVASTGSESTLAKMLDDWSK